MTSGPATVQAIYRYPVKGLSPRTRLSAGHTIPDDRLIHREWAPRLQPGSASLAAGWPAWHEFDLLGCTLTIGKTGRLKVVKRIQRCAATDVDPDTGIRDLTIPRTLMDNFNHTDCGVYAEVMAAGDIVVSDAVDVAVS